MYVVVCMRACVYARLCIREHSCATVCMRVHVRVCFYAYMCLYVHVRANVCAEMLLCPCRPSLCFVEMRDMGPSFQLCLPIAG